MNDELKLLREIAPDSERMLAVRWRVLAEIAAGAEPNWPLRLGWVFGLALVVVAMVSFWPRVERLDLSEIELPRLAEPPAFAYELTPPRPAASKPAEPKPVPEPQGIEVVRPTADGVLLRLASSDPDVILYYFLENPGD